MIVLNGNGWEMINFDNFLSATNMDFPRVSVKSWSLNPKLGAYGAHFLSVPISSLSIAPSHFSLKFCFDFHCLLLGLLIRLSGSTNEPSTRRIPLGKIFIRLFQGHYIDPSQLNFCNLQIIRDPLYQLQSTESEKKARIYSKASWSLKRFLFWATENVVK